LPIRRASFLLRDEALAFARKRRSYDSVGIDPEDVLPQRKAAKMPLHRELVERRIAELKSRIGRGGVREGAIRALLYAGMPRGAVDERGFEAIRQMRAIQDGTERPALAEFKAIVREQYFMPLIDPEACLAALPELLPDPSLRRLTLTALVDKLRQQ
jgi:hypothetical protein